MYFNSLFGIGLSQKEFIFKRNEHHFQIKRIKLHGKKYYFHKNWEVRPNKALLQREFKEMGLNKKRKCIYIRLLLLLIGKQNLLRFCCREKCKLFGKI